MKSYENLNKSKIFTSIATGIGFSIFVISILFKLLGWTGAELMLLIGLSILIISFMIGLLFTYKNLAIPFKSIVLKRIIFYAVLALLLFYFDRDKRLEMEFKDNPEFIEAVKRSWEDPSNKELKEKVEKERRKMEDE